MGLRAFYPKAKTSLTWDFKFYTKSGMQDWTLDTKLRFDKTTTDNSPRAHSAKFVGGAMYSGRARLEQAEYKDAIIKLARPAIKQDF